MSASANRVAVVTGASKGAGRAIAGALAREGMAVAMLARGKNDLVRAAEQIQRSGGRVMPMVADVSDEASVRAAFKRVEGELGGLDVLVLNAGVSKHLPVERTSLEDWRTILDTNLTGPFLCAREAVPLLRARGGGLIVAIGSGAGKQGYAGMTAYSSSKFGLFGLMQALAAELGEQQIKVSTIVPGSILTGFQDKPIQREPGKKYLLPEDVAEAVLFLVRQPPQAWSQEVLLWPFR